MASNFGTKIAITGFVWTVATRLLLMEGLSGQPTKCRYCNTLQLRDVAMASIFMAFYIWGAHWCHLANTCTTEPSMYGGDVALCQITLTTCYYYLSVPTPKQEVCYGLQKIEKINYSYWIRPVKIMSEWVQVLAQPGCSGSRAIKRVVVVIIIIALLLCWVRLCK